jgi:putative Holliday junction resolvase
VCALDLGKARVGVAVVDDLGLYAHPRPPLDGRNRRALLQAIAKLAREERIERFLVGLPLDMTGEHGPAARRATVFAQEVANATGCEVELVDERLSTVEAEAHLRARGLSRREARPHVDGTAAAVFLQSWLDARRDR